MIDAHFGESAPFSLGVEEELMILDAAGLDQVAAVDRILRGVEGQELPGSVKTELFASVFETNTNVCANAAPGINVTNSAPATATAIFFMVSAPSD